MKEPTNSSRPELNHPLLILLQVRGGDRLGDFLQGQLKVAAGHRHLQLLPGQRADLLGTQAADASSHGHQGRVPGRHQSG